MKILKFSVCDDCSSDKSLEIIKSIAYSDSRVKVYSSRKNQGPYNIRNELIKKHTVISSPFKMQMIFLIRREYKDKLRFFAIIRL
ncbi:glycosyltransferase family 2 protein [Escherichia coli]|nr:glycosyltransferase family 2 protein [Escherichia coli]